MTPGLGSRVHVPGFRVSDLEEAVEEIHAQHVVARVHLQSPKLTVSMPKVDRKVCPKLTGNDGETSPGGVSREQKMRKGHLARVIYHQVY